MDGEFVWFQKGASLLFPTIGLGPPGIINADDDPASTFLLQPYTSNNVLLIQPASQLPNPGVQTGTMTLSTPTPANSLAFTTASGFGPNSVGIVVHFADSTPDFAATISTPNWGGAPVRVTGAKGRVRINHDLDDSTGYQIAVAGEWTIAEIAVPLNEDMAHPVSSVDFTWLSTISADFTPYHNTAIFGISTSAASVGPYTAASLTANSFNADVVVESVPEPITLGLVPLVGVFIVSRKRKPTSHA
jgi:hypothetical protein